MRRLVGRWRNVSDGAEYRGFGALDVLGHEGDTLFGFAASQGLEKFPVLFPNEGTSLGIAQHGDHHPAKVMP
jgi:hypothetical protein